MLLAFWLSLLALAAPDARIESWRAEIERLGGAPVLIARIEQDAATRQLHVAPSTPQPEFFELYLKDPEFVRQLLQARALTVNFAGLGGKRNLIFLNMARHAEWGDNEEALIGHELGHAWVKAQGYATPVYPGGPTACLFIHAADVVQHVLIRDEMDRRGIAQRDRMRQDFEDSLPAWLRSGEAGLSSCDRVKLAAVWLDMRLGLTQSEWERRDEFEETLGKRFPLVRAAVDDLTAVMEVRDVSDKSAHRAALALVFERLRRLGMTAEKNERERNIAVWGRFQTAAG
jgi:hypothetical protein